MDLSTFLTDNRSLIIENFTVGFAAGLTVWFLSWGLNRTYLTYKKFLT